MMRQRGRGDSDDVLALDDVKIGGGHDLVIELDGLDDESKTMFVARSAPAVFSARAGIVLSIAWLFMAVVVDPPFVVYYIAAVVVGVGLAVRAHRQADGTTKEARRGCRCWAAAFASIVVGAALLQLMWEYEIRPMDGDFAWPVLALANATQLTPMVEFYRMYNPRLHYNSDIETVHRHLNKGTRPPRTQRLAIDPSMDVWSSDVFRYEFLSHTWRSTASSDRYRVVCLAESDVVYDEDYIAALLLPPSSKAAVVPFEPLELAHAQHFWGRRVFEPFNIALLCTSSHASRRTKLWAQLASFLHRKRYRRLLLLNGLYALVQNRAVLHWDAHHGCTRYHTHCKYIHFTQPKLAAIDEALHMIQGIKTIE